MIEQADMTVQLLSARIVEVQGKLFGVVSAENKADLPSMFPAPAPAQGLCACSGEFAYCIPIASDVKMDDRLLRFGPGSGKFAPRLVPQRSIDNHGNA